MTPLPTIFIGPPPKIVGPPLNLAPPQKNFFGLKFLGPPLKLGGGGLLPCRGSTLGPLFFLVAINDLSDSWTSNPKKYFLGRKHLYFPLLKT